MRQTMQTKYWKPEPSTNNSDIASLMEAAGKALADENAQVSQLLENASRKTGKEFVAAYGRAGRGLSYWFYEDTLVYLVWKAWVGCGRAVAWDWTVRDLRSGREQRPEEGDKQKIDLIVFGPDAAPQMAFEAKWWNSDSAIPAMLHDAEKMVDSQVLAKSQKFIMAFWWDLMERLSTWPDAIRKFTEKRRGLEYRGYASFPAGFFDGKDHVLADKGCFAVGLIEVTV